MKQTRSLLNSLVVCGVALAMISTLAAQSVTQGTAKVAKIVGAARYHTGDGQWKLLSVGMVLRPGAVVQTSKDRESYVDLILGEGRGGGTVQRTVAAPGAGPGPSSMSYRPSATQNTVRILDNTQMGIDKLTATQTGSDVVTETQLDLKAGRIMGNIKKMGMASRYEVKFPNGVAGIRGTAYWLSSDGVVAVKDGSVVDAFLDSNGNPATQVVTAGQQFDPRSGQTTPIPIFILDSLNGFVETVYVESTTAPVNYNYDHTIYFVSPTLGAPVSTGGGGD
jgi:FecR-like protein